MFQRKYTAAIIGVIFLALILRVSAPFPADLLGDEATYMFRSVGYFDHLFSQLQTTPYQWFETPPWWTLLSFHDHPPLSFAWYFAAFRMFGADSSVVRIMPVLMGLISVGLVTLIAHRMGGRRAGVAAGILAAVASGMIWISRVALLEGAMIPLVLAAFFATLRAQDNKRWWIGACIFFGGALLTKYTAIFLAPALITTGAGLWRSNKNRAFLLYGFLTLLLILAPVIVYNVMLLRTRGHPDYQVSRLLQITTSDWREDFSHGRSVNLWEAVVGVSDMVSYAGAGVFLTAIVWLAYVQRKRKQSCRGALLVALGSLFAGAAWVGPDNRFTVPLVPFFCIAAGVAWSDVMDRIRRVSYRALMRIAASAMLLTLIAYSVNTHVRASPRGSEGVTYSSARVKNYGYEQLDRYLLRVYAQRDSIADLWEFGAGETLYIYDSNMNYFPRLWYIQRRVTYQGIPYTSSQEFKVLVEQQGEDYFPSQGFSKFVFVHALPGALQVPARVRDGVADHIAVTLEGQGIEGTMIARNDGVPAFAVYEF